MTVYLPLINFVVLGLDIVIIAIFFFALYQAWQFRPKLRIFGRAPRKVLTLRDAVLKERWQEILRKIRPDSVSSMKLGIIEADKMADDVLKRMGFGGEHMADRLSQMNQADFSTVKRLWDAHRFRNNLVHSPDFEVRPEALDRALRSYEAFFREVGVL